MRRLYAGCVAATLLGSAFAYAEPPEKLLEQAVKERQGASNADVRAAAELLGQADRLMEQRKFDEAIPVYERAYRIDPANQETYAKLLSCKRAVGRMSDAEAEALKLIDDGRALRIEDSLRVVRLDIIQARDALRQKDKTLAAGKVTHARTTLGHLPRDIDVTIYERELSKLYVAAGGRPAKAKPAAAPRGGADRDLNLGEMDQQPATNPTEEPRPELADSPDEMRGRLMREEQTYEPQEDLENYFGVWPQTTNRKYAAEMDRAIRASRAEWYFDAAADGVTPRGDMAYPADWAQKTARRARYEGGEIYRGPITKDKDGREVYTAVYDLGDLVAPVPNFYGWDPNALNRLQGLLDRQALRDRSQIFGGWPEDLAAGLPLMPFFGGVDNWAISPRSDPHELDQVLRTIDTFVGR